MTTAVVTRPRRLSHAASMRIINSAHTDWRTWLAACLFPFKLYVALAFLWIVKWNASLPNLDSDMWILERENLGFFAENVALGYLICGAVLILGTSIQLYVGAYRAALVNGLFGLAALIVALAIFDIVPIVMEHEVFKPVFESRC
jgi:hypothetical protein